MGEIRITARKNGPYRVEGDLSSLKLVDAEATNTTSPAKLEFHSAAAEAR